MKNTITLSQYLADIVSDRAHSVIPAKAGDDSLVKEENRKQYDRQVQWLVKRPHIIEKVYSKIFNTISGINQSEVIVQACMINNLYDFDVETSRKMTAQSIFILHQTGVLKLFKRESTDMRKYFKVSLVDDDNVNNLVAIRRMSKKLKKKNRRVSLDEASKKVGRNNNNGFYSFDNKDNPFAARAVEKQQEQKLRFVPCPDVSFKDIAEVIFHVFEDDSNTKALYEELTDEFIARNGKSYHVTKTLDRILRIYGHRWMDISSSSKFRPMLRFSRKRKVTVDGLEAYKLEIDAANKELRSITEDDNLNEHSKHILITIFDWHITELESLEVGSYTNIMHGIDANNQGPAIICGLVKDKYWFNKYWGDADAPKMYEVFRVNLMEELGLPTNTLDDIDVKYKIMTKPYNKQDTSNVFGDKDFLAKLENSYLPGLFLASFSFYELPLKMQLQRKLGDAYAFEDDELLAAYKRAITSTAPFLESFQQLMKFMQDDVTIKPSIWNFKSINGDICHVARTKKESADIQFLDMYGTSHSFMYEFKTLIENNKFGGETALSPGVVAGVDAGLAALMVIKSVHDIWSNHDEFFVHGNDRNTTLNNYTLFFSRVLDYSDSWWNEMNVIYSFKRLKSIGSIAEVIGTKEILTKGDIFLSKNLIG